MLSITKALQSEPDFSKLLSAIDAGGCPAVLSGLSEIHRAHAAAALRALTGRPLAVICSDDGESIRLARDIESLTGEAVYVLGTRDFIFHNAEVVSRQLEQARLGTLFAMSSGPAQITVMSAAAALLRTIPPDLLVSSSMTLELGGTYNLSDVSEKLILCGYSRCEQVEGAGQFALRGGILDFYSPAHPDPVRCEFFGDEIDSMGFFDTSTQRRTEHVSSVMVVPVAETLPSLYCGEHGVGAAGLAAELEALQERLSRRRAVSPELIKNLSADAERLKSGRTFPAADRYVELIYPMATAADYLYPDTLVLLCEPLRTSERAELFLKQLGEDGVTLLENGVLESGLVRFSESWDGLLSQLESFPAVMLDSFPGSTYPIRPKSHLNVTAKRLSSYGGSLETAASDIAYYKEAGFRTVILCHDKRRANSLLDFLDNRGITAALDLALEKLPDYGSCVIAEGALSAGMEYPGQKLAVITEGQFFAQTVPGRRKKKEKSNRERLQSYSDLSPGDMVVHDHHGIGRFAGIVKMPVDGVEKDYIKIAYAGTDVLYVPATQLDLVAKYIGGGEDSPVRLSKMGGADWTRVKTRAKAAAKELARELIKLYAERQRARGHAFPQDSVWQTEFEERFGYQETDDQLRCAEEIKSDMEKPVPMDRLLCGDVGYGKTEIALRAVMKCVMDGYQAVILVPTTVLAQQHYVTAMRRFSGYPINIDVLSRFRTQAQVKSALRELETGGVDLIIGTHRLLQKDIKFKKLGLLVVDEEQRFGVSHKERLKEIAKQVDVLTLSATPIPRTLNMALSGIRDMSSIESPPLNRQPVQTYVMEHDWGVLSDAIRREISRGGQVYYLHNRIDNIERVVARLSELLEGVTISVAHGRMDEDSLSDVMERMSSGELQVLVSTTIIESGIDIPNVNTLIVEDADKLGLAQLHQIRGRVGRSPRRAYAYLTFRRGKALSEIAEKRLSAIREFAEFNSGFKIAMRDLEIRGAGSLLGAEQSGHMISVGYDMYLKLLEEAVLEEKGDKTPLAAECPADLSVSATIPEKYVPSSQQRMDLYRRIARIRTEEDCDDMIAELIDRYGDPPSQVITLTTIALMRGEAARAGIAEITQKDGWLRLKLSDFDMERVSKLYATPGYTGRVRVVAGTEPVLAFKMKGNAVVDDALKFVRAYAATKA